MHNGADRMVPRPDHVPPAVVMDFDVHNPPGAATDLHAAWRKLQDGPDIVWAPYHGGYWVPTRHEDIVFMQLNVDPFSMRDVTMPANTRPTRLLPLEADPPERAGFRAILNPWFSPKRINALDFYTRQLAVDLIGGFKPRGECEFMSEFALILPIAIFMHLTNLPESDREILLRYTQMTTRGTASERAEAYEWMTGYLNPVIIARRADAGDDLLSTVIHAKPGGVPLGENDLMSMLLTILFGGLDTVASAMGFIADFLSAHPDHRQFVIDNPDRTYHAVDELMRRFSPSNTARTLTRDYEYKGIVFKKDDKVYVPPVMAGMDERRYEHAWEIDFTRKDVVHASFGNGPHRCLGSLPARLEIKIFLEEWLKCIPDFRVKGGEAPVYGPGQVNCVERLVLSWNI